MRFTPTKIPDVVVIEPQTFGDERGFFMEVWHQEKFREAGIDVDFVQENHSKSRRGVLRGLHYQLNRPQGKLVRVIQGVIHDIAVDIRRSSVTFGQWVGVELSADNKQMIWVPPGFAHGFAVKSDSAEIVYCCTELYDPEDERVILWRDPGLSIDWRLPPDIQPVLSAKDVEGTLLKDAETYP